ncbi:DNA-directed DNA polymerase, partial [Tanacetum coccineum]
LRKEKEEAQQKKYLENLKQLYINMPFIEALAQMPKYAKFLKGLLKNKAKLEEACTITMNERCSAVLLNKLPSKEKDPGSFTIPCDISQLYINNALADLGASNSLMPYTMYEKLGLGEPKATRMSLELTDRSIQYPREIIENVLIKVDKFVLLIDFVILDMLKDLRVPIILGRPFLATARAMIDVCNKKITLRVGDDEVIFDVDQSIKRPPTEDDECYRVDDLDDMINAEETTKPVEVEREHLYSASANEIDEKKPELKDLPHHLENAYLHGDKSFPIIISSELSEKENFFTFTSIGETKRNDCLENVGHQENHPIHVMLKKGGMTIVLNDNNELIPSRTDRMLARCEETNLVLNWEKCHFMVKEGIVLGHKILGQDAKPRLIRWVPLLQGFDIEIKDKRGAENLVVDHLSRLENPDFETFTEEEIADKFPDEHLMVLKTELNNDEPCASVTGRKVYESGFFWPSIFKDAIDYVMRCDACQRSGNISSRSEMPQNNIQIKHKAYWVLKQCNMDLTAVAKNRFMELNELMELRDGAYENTLIHKERIKRWHNSRLRGDKNFKVGDMVLIFNSRFKMHPGKQKSRWYSPNVVKTVYPYGTVEITGKNEVSFKVNGQRLKKYQERHIDAEVVEFEDDTT